METTEVWNFENGLLWTVVTIKAFAHNHHTQRKFKSYKKFKNLLAWKNYIEISQVTRQNSGNMAKTIGPTTGYVRNTMQTVTRIQQNCFYHHWTHRREGVTLQFLKFPLFWYFWKNSTPLLIITPSCFVFRVHISEGKIIKTKLLMLNSFFQWI